MADSSRIFVDNNIFLYGYKPKILGGNLESLADITIANANLQSPVAEVFSR